ncbi:Sodium:dicarboxylate symporter family [Actinomyces slackii]|uniref:Sodium:dicarboxylate symporter family n=1 Tax=Actinomyces slackii TaxID=52774 RepID=A0A3S4WH04_9ACTO|nr:Sodium:dicarboxylate symporter family [Actinomyces slackii]
MPLCATIHLAGSTSKIFAFAFAIALSQGIEISAAQWVGFIFMLGITMVAAPGVPGGAIMAATGLLSSMLGFNEDQVALMIATYIALDSFGTATNVTGDGAIALIVDRMAGGRIGDEAEPANIRRLAFDGMAYLHGVSIEGVVSPEDLDKGNDRPQQGRRGAARRPSRSRLGRQGARARRQHRGHDQVRAHDQA